MRSVNHHRGCCGTNPTRPDGTEWAHVIILHNGSDVRADTATEVFAELISGYDDLDETGQRDARIRHAEKAAVDAQRILAEIHHVSDPAIRTVLEAPRSTPLGISSPDDPDAPPRWDGAVPLLLVTTTYAPYTDAPTVGGNVLWLDPSEEQAYLDSLGAARIYDYWRDPEAACL